MTRALVTGATAGIGHAFASELAARGHDLVVVARDTARLEALAKELSSRHDVTVDVLTADLSTEEGLSAATSAVTSTSRPVDLLVNNAGSSFPGWYGTTDIADEDAQLDLLVRAPMHLMDAALKVMSGRRGGAVVNVASVAAFTPRGTYSAHKAWLVNLSQWANLHYADVDIRVQALCPGFVRTEFHQRMGADISGIPRWMWLKPRQVVKGSLKDLERGRSVSVPSVRYKVLATLSRILPAGLVARAAKRGR